MLLSKYFLAKKIKLKLRVKMIIERLRSDSINRQPLQQKS